MGFEICCPNCGPRNVYEFKFGLEVKDEPSPGEGLKEWRHYIYFNKNICGVQEEWWCHSSGCLTWFKVKRDTSTNEIIDD